MCTGLAVTSGNFYFGRNLDLNYEFDQKVVITPRNFTMTYKCDASNSSHYAMIGMATIRGGFPLYADAMNEKGLCMASLNFKDFAVYPVGEVQGKKSLTSYEIINWVLQSNATVKEAREALKNVILVDIPLMDGVPVAPLHWLISDKDESIVLEQTEEGLQLIDNPIGVLTNNPPFKYHLMSLRNYRNLSVDNGENTFTDKVELKPLGVGMGGIGLPGDSSPNSRFVKATFLRSHAAFGQDNEENIALFFHILDNVAMVKGTVNGNDGTDEYTMYTACMNGTTGDYIYKTYKHISPVKFNIFDENLDTDKLIDKGYLG